ncbi:uncharacterized protein LOC129608373 [Condylostylus longicornis]|uniref:uncharacterized protein LOC129608373 n=1 Tax=Condylostylus longicornis TaxID=2530218 RepID=UPI00244E4541|nr:uncharacterized protein LOC129608373 [Condylostylus longicornis]
MSALYQKILPTVPDMITLDIDSTGFIDSAEASVYNSLENLSSKDYEDYQKMMEESIKKTGWNLENFEAAVDKGGNPFQICDNSKENCYQKLLKKEILIKTDYEDALEYREMCIDWIRQNPSLHLENVTKLINISSDFGREQVNKLKKILQTDHYDVLDVLQDLLEESFEANDIEIFLTSLANGADILLKDSISNESVFDGIISRIDRYEYFKVSYYFIFRHKQYSKSEVISTMNIIYHNKDPDMFVELSNYMFLAAVSNTLPLEIAKFIEIARNFGQFKAFHKSLDESVFLSYSYNFYDKLFANYKLKNEAKYKIIEMTFETHKSNIEALLDHRDYLKKISLDIDERLELVFIMENNIIWKETATFKKRFRKFFEKHQHEIKSDTNVKYDFIDLITSAIYYDNIEAMRVILDKAFECCAHTKKQLRDSYFRNQNLIGINELICVKFLYDEVMKNDFTLLSYAINKDSKDAISELLKRGAHLMIKDSYYRSNVIYFEKHPKLLENHLDNCLLWYDEYLDQEEKFKDFYYEKNPQLLDERKNLVFKKKLFSERILLNFKNFIPPDEFHHKNEKIFDVILDLAQSNNLNYLLKHPLITSLIILKWNSLSKISSVIVVMMLIFFILRELFQFYLMKWSYFTHVIDWLQIILILLIILTLPLYNFHKETIKGFTSLAILFSAMELSVVIRSASLSFLSVYVIIFEQVIKTYLKISILFGIYIASFSFCFMILFGHEINKEQKIGDNLKNGSVNESAINYNKITTSTDTVASSSSSSSNDENEDNDLEGLEFGNYVPTAIKTLVMFVGEYEGGTIMFHSKYYWGYLIFFIFVCSMALVAVNLLHGLAVSDVQAIIHKAELNNLIFKASMLPKYEKALNQLSKTRFLHRTDFYVDYFVNSRILVNDDRTVTFAEFDNGNKYSRENFQYRFGLKELHISKGTVQQIKQILQGKIAEREPKPLDPIRTEIDEIKRLLNQVLHNTDIHRRPSENVMVYTPN